MGSRQGNKITSESEEGCEENRTENVVWPHGSQREGTVVPPRRHLAASGGTFGRHNWREWHLKDKDQGC